MRANWFAQMRKVIKIILGSLFAIFSIFSLLPAAFIIWTMFFPVCNIHGKETSLSPDGIWRATWYVTGCSYFEIVGDNPIWHSKIMVSKTTWPAKASILIFKSDGADDVTFTWPERNTLYIEIPAAANITRSERNASGLSVTYKVPASVLRNLAKRLKEDDRQISLSRKKTISSETLAALANRKLTERLAKSDRRYLDRFRTWSRTYAQPILSHPN
jgi:hypothetical protein